MFEKLKLNSFQSQILATLCAPNPEALRHAGSAHLQDLVKRKLLVKQDDGTYEPSDKVREAYDDGVKDAEKALKAEAQSPEAVAARKEAEEYSKKAKAAHKKKLAEEAAAQEQAEEE